MANFSALLMEPPLYCEYNLKQQVSHALSSTATGFAGPEAITGVITFNKTARVPAEKTAVKSHDFVEEQIYNRIWLYPLAIEAGFVLEEIGYEISVWNAFRNKDVSFTGITPVNPEGLIIDRPQLPAVLNADKEQSIPVTVTSEGPAVQDMMLLFTIESAVHAVHITAKRTLLITLEPNWNEPVSLTYEFQTVISRSETIKEQRRSLLPEPVRTLSASFLTESVEAQMLLHTLLYGHDKLIGTPVFPEPVHADQLHAGSTVITAANDITAYWNLNHLSDYLFLIDRKSGAHELIKIIAVSGQLIRLETPVTLNFSPETTTLYPLFFCVIQATETLHHTRVLNTTEITLKEFISG